MSDQDVNDQDRTRRFERMALPHLDAAYALARWLAGGAQDAEDIVQEAYLRAFTYFDGYRGDNARAWLLSVTRNAAFDWLRRNRPSVLVPLDEVTDESGAMHGALTDDSPTETPETVALRKADRATLNRLVAELPLPYREVLVLREVHELGYREIADVAAIPVGTVMSRLARARALIRRGWLEGEPRPIERHPGVKRSGVKQHG